MGFRPFKKRGPLEMLLDARQKIFEGEFRAAFYSDRATIDGYCWHCQSRVHYEMRLTPLQVAAITKDAQFRQNMADHLAEQLENHHQCGLLHEGKDLLTDFERDLQRSGRAA